MSTVVILGAGQIGTAFNYLLSERIKSDTAKNVFPLTTPFANFKVELWDAVARAGVTHRIDLLQSSTEDIAAALKKVSASHVINTLPFFLNEKVGQAAHDAGCNYIDFTEDDVMAEKVQAIFKDGGLTCAVKCGLAPGYINYLGAHMARLLHRPESLLLCVGALPRHVQAPADLPHKNYNLTWSVDGLVNEYIRPCRVRAGGQVQTVPALTGQCNIFIDGVQFEAAHTSGGIGSLVDDLTHVPDIRYKTLRYPHHYDYIKSIIETHAADHESIKRQFLNDFPYTSSDVIVVYAEVVGRNEDGVLRREVFADRFYGIDGALTAIQTTTAGGGLTILEMMLTGHLSGIVKHTDVDWSSFINTSTASLIYNRR